jgi:hypothetical protein
MLVFSTGGFFPAIAHAQYSGDGGCCGNFYDVSVPDGNFYDTSVPTGNYYDVSVPTGSATGNYYDVSVPTGNYYDVSVPTGAYYDVSVPTGAYYDVSVPAGMYNYGGYPSYGSTGYGSASLGIGLGFGSSYYPTSVFYPTTSFYPTSIPISAGSTYSPTTISNPTNTYAPTSVYSPTSTYAPTSVYSPTSTYAPTTVSTYAPTNTSTYAPTSYASSVYSPSSVYAPSDSHNVVGPTTISTDSHNNTTISVVSNTAQAAPQYPVQYIYGGGSYFGGGSYYNTPTYFPSYIQAPTCTITASASGYNYNYNNRAVVLSWTSTNANSGYITPLVGTVAPAGSTTVYPNQNTLYTLTVSGNGGTSSCQTYAGASNVVAAAVAPYVALTQIPYTGFDFGTFGNAIYWTLLVGFAVAVSYLALYFRGGAFAVVKSMVRSTNSREDTLKSKGGTLAKILEETPSKSEGVTSETKSHSGTAFRGPSTGAATTGGTKDSMLSIGSSEGIGPRIIVLRA